MKQLKLYIPIVTPKRKVILVSTQSCKELSKIIPSYKEIYSHLVIQKQLMKQGEKFSSLKISIPMEEMKVYKKEISSKIAGKYISPVIDLILGSGQYPIVQLVEKIKEPVVEVEQ